MWLRALEWSGSMSLDQTEENKELYKLHTQQSHKLGQIGMGCVSCIVKGNNWGLIPWKCTEGASVELLGGGSSVRSKLNWGPFI